MLHETLASDLIMVLETTADGDISVRASTGEKSPAPPPVPSPDVRRTVGHMRAAGETLFSADLSTETTFDAPGSRPRACSALSPRRSARARRRSGAGGVQPPARRVLRERPRLRRVGREPADGRGRTRSHGRREPQGACARHRARGAAQRRAAAGAHGQLGRRLRDGHAHAVGEHARDARAGLVHLHRRHLRRAHPSRDRERMQVGHGRAPRTMPAPTPRPAPGRPVRHCVLFRPIFDTAGVATGLRGTVKDVRRRAGRRRPAALGGALPPGLRQRPDRDVARRPGGMRYLRVNDAFCAMVGQTRAALLELTFAEVSEPRTAADRPGPAAARERRAPHREALSAARRHRGVGLRQRHARPASRTAPSTCCSGRWSTSPSARRARRR